jgi:hypothetical protein
MLCQPIPNPSRTNRPATARSLRTHVRAASIRNAHSIQKHRISMPTFFHRSWLFFVQLFFSSDFLFLFARQLAVWCWLKLWLGADGNLLFDRNGFTLSI